MLNSASILENDKHTLPWDFDIQTDHQILARRPVLIIINNNNKKKRIRKIVDIAVPADHRTKLEECEKKDNYLNLEKTMEHEGDNCTNRDLWFWCSN